MKLTFDETIKLKATIDNVTGFLTAPVTLSRIGIQHYLGSELGINDRVTEKIGVYRPASEVFHPDSINSFINLVITDDHPSGIVTVDNVSQLQKGTVSNVVPVEKKTLDGIATITDKNQIEKAKDGKVEVSVGYSHDLKKESGSFDGEQYEFIQTNIRANHLAIVDAGRCGSACKLTLDKKEKIMHFTIDGIEYETEDSQLVQAVRKMQESHDAEIGAVKKKAKEDAEKEKEKLDEEKKKREKAEATADSLKSEQLSDEKLNNLIADRAVLLVQAEKILGKDKMPECTDCPKELKTAVIDHVTPDLDLDGKSDDYIDAAYDMAIEKVTNADGKLKKLGEDFTADSELQESRDTARGKYMKDHLGIDESA